MVWLHLAIMLSVTERCNVMSWGDENASPTPCNGAISCHDHWALMKLIGFLFWTGRLIASFNLLPCEGNEINGVCSVIGATMLPGCVETPRTCWCPRDDVVLLLLPHRSRTTTGPLPDPPGAGPRQHHQRDPSLRLHLGPPLLCPGLYHSVFSTSWHPCNALFANYHLKTKHINITLKWFM